MVTKKNSCESPNMRFLKKLRGELTQYSMAKKLGMIPNTYIHYETKAQGIKLDALVHIRKVLNLSWPELGEMIEKEVEENKRSKNKS